MLHYFLFNVSSFLFVLLFYNKSAYSQLGTENACGKNDCVKMLR
jgi:hypothetical protein